MSSTCKITIRSGKYPGDATIELNGQDISQYLTGVHVDMEVDQLPAVRLDLTGIDVEFVAEAAVLETSKPGQEEEASAS